MWKCCPVLQPPMRTAALGGRVSRSRVDRELQNALGGLVADGPLASKHLAECPRVGLTAYCVGPTSSCS